MGSCRLHRMTSNLVSPHNLTLTSNLLKHQNLCMAELPPPDPEAPQRVAEAPPDPEAPVDGPPDWCNCGHCRAMPTQTENKCCCRRRSQCTSTLDLFQLVVLNGNVLDIAMRYREDVFALDHPRSNENFRHMAYRQ